MTYGRQLAARRLELGWSQTQLSMHLTRAGLPWSRLVISRVEIGRREVMLCEADVLMRVLRLPYQNPWDEPGPVPSAPVV